MRFYKQNSNHAMREKKMIKRRWFVNKTSRFFLLCLVAIMGVMYLITINSIATKGYEIAEFEKQIRELEHENEKLNFQIAKFRSIHSIQERLQNIEMVPAGRVSYVEIIGNVFVRR